MASSKICDLPEELIVRILSELDVRDLLSCAPTCSIMHRTIRDAVTLQYTIELASAGLEDNKYTSSHSIAEKLDEVKARQDGWYDMRFRERHRLSVPPDQAWEFLGGILSYGLVNPAGAPETRGLAFTELPSISQGTSLKTWKHRDLGVAIEDFTIDPLQNLVAFIAHVPFSPPPAPPEEHRVHLITMDTGKPHPIADSQVLRCIPNVFTDREPNFLIQIMDEYVALVFRSRVQNVNRKQEIFIWNWKTGRLFVNFMYPLSRRATRMDCFTFLSPRHFAVSRVHHSLLVPSPPVIDVYAFDIPDSDEAKEPKLVRSFMLPQIATGTLLTCTMMRTHASSNQPSLSSKPVWTSTSPRLLAVCIDIFRGAPGPDAHGIDHASFVLFVHHSTLLNDFELEQGGVSENPVPWDSWGPDKSRMLPTSHNQRVWICFIHGTRFVRLEAVDEQVGREGGVRLRMLDFNPLLVKRGKFPRRGTPDGRNMAGMFDTTSESNSVCNIVLASQLAVISAPDYFAHDVTTALPYRDVWSQEIFDYDAVMVDEECLLGIKQSASNASEKIVEVLCF